MKRTQITEDRIVGVLREHNASKNISALFVHDTEVILRAYVSPLTGLQAQTHRRQTPLHAETRSHP